MRVLDRYTGEQLPELSGEVIPGRYCVLEPAVFNGHTKMKVGDILVNDGSSVFTLEGEEYSFAETEFSESQKDDAELFAEAIIAIAGKLANSQGSSVSPMLPSELAAQCKLEEVERCLAGILRDGHLHAISDRPRRDLRYDEFVAPVARVRRMATSALSHLASHSDCWQQRTLSGVTPRKVLARLSEDDYALYENRLYKRLIDRLERHLVNRLRRIRSVNSRLEKALKFQDSDLTHYRVRRDICTLWGETYQDDNTGVQLEAGKIALIELEFQLRAVRSLKQRGLYTLLPANAVVPAQVRRTNILNHDPHYMRLPLLWERLRNEKEERQLAPEERLARQQQLQAAYSSYVGLVLRRALGRYGYREEDGRLSFGWAGRMFTVHSDRLDWIITAADGVELRLVPGSWHGDPEDAAGHVSAGRIICWPGIGSSDNSPQFLIVSPLDLYVVERMGRLIDEWLLRRPIDGYGRKLGPLPSAVKRLTDGWPDQFEGITTTHVRLIAPLSAQQVADLKVTLRSSANAQVTALVESAIEEVDVLSRQCGHKAQLIFSPPTGFYCKCQTCQSSWSLMPSGGKRRFSARPKGGEVVQPTDGFMWSGRDWLDIEVR
jgi:hypothetical protein